MWNSLANLMAATHPQNIAINLKVSSIGLEDPLLSRPNLHMVFSSLQDQNHPLHWISLYTSRLEGTMKRTLFGLNPR